MEETVKLDDTGEPTMSVVVSPSCGQSFRVEAYYEGDMVYLKWIDELYRIHPEDLAQLAASMYARYVMDKSRKALTFRNWGNRP